MRGQRQVNCGKYRGAYCNFFPPYSHNVRHIAEVAASNTLSPRATAQKQLILSTRGSAAILPICLLGDVAAFRHSFQITVFFRSSPNIRNGAWKSPKPNMASAIFGCAGLQYGVCAVVLCAKTRYCKRGKATGKTCQCRQTTKVVQAALLKQIRMTTCSHKIQQ